MQNLNVGRSDQKTAGEGKKLDLQSPQPAREAYPYQSSSTRNFGVQKIRAIQRDFLWRGAENKNKWALVAYEKVCRQKRKGDLGLKYPQVTNGAYGPKL